jgi:alpha-tubulin suppressor-like RCC1 family protein
MQLNINKVPSVKLKNLDPHREWQIQKTIPTKNNHQAIARKMITVTSFGVGEGIIRLLSCCPLVGNKKPTLDKLIQLIGIVLLF